MSSTGLARVIASGGGAGFAPWAPGTAGSVVGVVLGALLLSVSPWLLLAATLIACVGGIHATALATGLPWQASGEADHADPQWVVIDEIVGQFVALLALPRLSWAGVALAFLLFRAFDIAKPGPIGWADRQGGALGVMADDVLAGMAAGCVGGLVELWPG